MFSTDRGAHRDVIAQHLKVPLEKLMYYSVPHTST